jgi:hypothetical protein
MQNNETLVHFAVQAVQTQCVQGGMTVEEARETLAAFGGIPHTGKKGQELFLFVGQTWDVEVLTSPKCPERCILWLSCTPG